MSKNQSKIDAEKLELRLRAIADITAGIAHEINNPLTVIQARVYQLELMVKKNQLNNETVTTIADSIGNTTEKVAGLIRSLRNLSRKDLTEIEGEIELNAFLDDTLALCRARFANHGVEIRTNHLHDEVRFHAKTIALQMQILIEIYRAFDQLKSSEETEKNMQVELFEQNGIYAVSITHSAQSEKDKAAQVILTPIEVA